MVHLCAKQECIGKVFQKKKKSIGKVGLRKYLGEKVWLCRPRPKRVLLLIYEKKTYPSRASQISYLKNLSYSMASWQTHVTPAWAYLKHTNNFTNVNKDISHHLLLYITLSNFLIKITKKFI